MNPELHESAVHIGVDAGVVLPGDLVLPPRPMGLVVFAHGSGSSRHSPRNRHVARQLQRAGMATLLTDLLTPQEDEDETRRFDIALLARRLDAVTQWARQQPATAALPVGYFGASTGAAAALWAAADQGDTIAAVVSRGGRPDLAGTHALARVTAPTLLLVGGHDGHVLELNRKALARLHCPKRLQVVPGATHLFEEPGTLDQVAREALMWFAEYFVARSAPGDR